MSLFLALLSCLSGSFPLPVIYFKFISLAEKDGVGGMWNKELGSQKNGWEQRLTSWDSWQRRRDSQVMVDITSCTDPVSFPCNLLGLAWVLPLAQQSSQLSRVWVCPYSGGTLKILQHTVNKWSHIPASDLQGEEPRLQVQALQGDKQGVKTVLRWLIKLYLKATQEYDVGVRGHEGT